MSTEVRWKQRLQNFEKAMMLLEEAAGQENYTNLEKAGLAQTFEFTFELAWQTLKDLLEFEGYEVNSPRAVINQAFKTQYIMDVDVWLLALESRNLLAHTYNEQNATEAVNLIKERFLPSLSAVLRFLRDKRANE